MDILKAEIILKSKKREERNEASRIQKNVTKLEFVFVSVILSTILSEVNLASKLLQTTNLDLMKATATLAIANRNIKAFRKNMNYGKN